MNDLPRIFSFFNINARAAVTKPSIGLHHSETVPKYAGNPKIESGSRKRLSSDLVVVVADVHGVGLKLGSLDLREETTETTASSCS